eukprot:TRINITY_DN18623_c0_g1_i1.p1 TRINITY_DN18623_c0_g1~~TRINITY_DN18623_c0_g1_i1.p1  ORF type:complete len:147 (+),score=12.17 TRINITY_DN18623_c0_g1_i1:126-566(+)
MLAVRSKYYIILGGANYGALQVITKNFPTVADCSNMGQSVSAGGYNSESLSYTFITTCFPNRSFITIGLYLDPNITYHHMTTVPVSSPSCVAGGVCFGTAVSLLDPIPGSREYLVGLPKMNRIERIVQNSTDDTHALFYTNTSDGD